MVVAERPRPRPAPDTLGNSSGNPREIRQGSKVISGDYRRLLVPPEGRLLFKAEPRLEDTRPRTLESTIKERLKITKFNQLPKDQLGIARAAVFYDTREDVEHADSLGYFLYTLWYRSGSLDQGVEYLGISKERQKRIINSILDHKGKAERFQEDLELLEETEKVIEGHSKKVVVEKFGKIADRVSDLLSQGMTIGDISSDFKKLVLTWLRTENEKENFVNEVERLSSQGLKAKEIAPMLGIGTSIVEDVIRGLVVIGRLEPRRNSKRTRDFIDFARKVETYRKRKKNRLNNSEIADKLKNSTARVRDAARALIAVGAIEPFSMSEARRIQLGTYENKEKLRDALENAQSRGQKKVFLSRLMDEADLTYKGIEPVSVLYHEIEEELEGQVPRIASNSRERARKRLRELIAEGLIKLNLRQISRDEGIPYKTLIRAYHDIENEPGVPKLKQEVAADKKQKLRKRLLEYLSTHPGIFFNMRQASRDLEIGYTLSLHWYHEIAEVEAVPPIRPQGRKKLSESIAA